MINRISQMSGIKKGILAAMMLAGTTMYAANPIKNSSNAPKQNQTEVVSKEGAEALKVNMIQQTSVPTVHNSKLDNTLRKFAESDEDKKYIENVINNVYKTYGTYLGSALMQHEINVQMLYALMTGNTNLLIKNNINPELGKKIQSYGPDFFRTFKPSEQKVMNWMLNKYTPNLLKALSADHKMGGEEVLKNIDDVVNKHAKLTKNQIIDYVVDEDDFDYRMKRSRDTQSLSDLAAYKMYLLDKVMIERELHNYEVLGLDVYNDADKPVYEYVRDWFESIAPKH